MTHEELKAILPLAALDRLEPDQARELREHLGAGCAECEEKLRELRAAAAARSSAPRAGSRGVDATRRGAASVRALRISIAAALLLAVYSAGVTIHLFGVQNAYRDRLAYFERQFTGLQSAAQNSEQQVNALAQVLSERVRLEHVLDAPDLQITRLGPLGPAPGAHALVAVSKASHSALIQVSELPPAPEGKTYELWWITKEKGPLPAGLFNAESGREVVAKVEPPPAGQRVMLGAVTLEVAGGADRPSGAMYLKGAPEKE